MRLRLLLAMLTASLLGTGTKAQAAKDDKESLQGAWHLVSMEQGGQRATDTQVKNLNFRMVIAGEKLSVTGEGETKAAAFRLDASQKPTQIDVIVGKPDEKPDVHRGIYLLDGDSLKICLTHPPNERPTEFVTQANSKWPVLFVLKRSGEPDEAKLQGAWRIVSAEKAPGRMADEYKDGRIVFDKDKLTLCEAGANITEITFDFKLDPTKLPQTMDLIALNGKDKGDILPAIYLLDGDSLKLCFAVAGKRPTEFATQPGRKLMLFVLKRAKP